jgi:cell division protein FtsB
MLLFFTAGLFAQHPSNKLTPDAKTDIKLIRIVDTLTPLEKSNRNPVILQSEFDSLVKQYNSNQVQLVEKETGKAAIDSGRQYMLGGLFFIMVLLGVVIYLFYRHGQKINRTLARLNEKSTPGEFIPGHSAQANAKEKNTKGKMMSPSLEAKISDLHAELNKLSKENEGLNRVIKEYNGIQHEFDSLRHGILKTYKVKNYPGYDKTKDETWAMQGVFQTEKLVANYAYEKFMKPILAITDQNKNSPARLSDTDREKLLDLLVSLSLLYIEYLYLRVNDLSIGGRIAERIQGLGKGNGPDISLLKKLNTEFGSRALVLKMALNKAELHQLSYPVFDETNLNNQ